MVSCGGRHHRRQNHPYRPFRQLRDEVCMERAAASVDSATLLSASQGVRNPKAAEILQRGYRTTWCAVRDRRQRRVSGNLCMLLVSRTRIENCRRRLGAASLHTSKILSDL